MPGGEGARRDQAMQLAERQRWGTGVWMLSAFSLAACIAGAAFALHGSGEEATILGLKLTARWSYLLFWLAYIAHPLVTLIGARAQPLAARARDFGLAFAAAHLVHIGLVVWLYRIAVHPPGPGTLRFFGVAVIFTYLLALLSFRRISGSLPSRAVSVIRTIGIEYIALAFLVDFARNPFQGSLLHALSYGPFLGMGLLAYGVRLSALIRSRMHQAGVRQGLS